MDDVELLQKLRVAFRQEAEERLASITSNLLELERSADPDTQHSILEVIFRQAHSLKGASRAVNLTDIEAICQSMESVFGALRRSKISVSAELCDTLHDSVSVVERMLLLPEEEGHDERQVEAIEPIIERLTSLVDCSESACSESAEPMPPAIAAGPDDTAPTPPRNDPAPEEAFAGTQPESEQVAPTGSTTPSGKSLATGTVRIDARKLDSLLLKAEELVSLKLTARHQVEDLRHAAAHLGSWNERRTRLDSALRSLRRKSDRIGRDGGNREGDTALAEVLEFVDWTQEQLRALGGELEQSISASDENQRSLGRMVDSLLEEMKKVAMLPFSTLFALLPKMVRDLSREQGKAVDLVIEGGEIEIDKRILEELKNPLIHLLRNALDHGLESPDEREERQKPPRGTLRLSVVQTESSRVEIVLADDGKGIDPERVKQKAVEKGLLSNQEAGRLDTRRALSLVFRSGMSTSPTITRISGRGLGLAIVQEGVEALGGTVAIDSTPGAGTTFRLQLPVTLATFRGVLVQVAGETYVLPSTQVERVLRVATAAIRTVEGRDTMPLDGRTLPLVDLAQLLQTTGAAAEQGAPDAARTVVILGAGDQRIGFTVQEVEGEHEVLVKNLGKQLRRMRNIAGATILGSGQVALILNANDLLVSAAGTGMPLIAGTAGSVDPAAGKVEQETQTILVVDDSITSRILLQNILEGAGYTVETAVDGSAGYTMMQSGAFDLVVSDVEMPNMNGFELTSRIRATEELQQTPVVLVTCLSSREDRELGIEAGANAYIVKSNFDQSNLVDVIRRLI